MIPRFYPYLAPALKPLAPYLTTGAFNQPGPGLLLALWVLLLVWLLGVA